MDNQIETARLDWRDGSVPVSLRFDDPYFSMANGLEETRHVFLDGNDLPRRLTEGFHVAELGFGTGLNLLALWQAWRSGSERPRIFFTSFEAYPMAPDDMARAHAAFPELTELGSQLVAQWATGARSFTLDGIEVEVICGDANVTLPSWSGKADAWFLDGFSPAKNPDLWSPDLMAEIGRKTRAGGSFATYTAAGHVRRALAEAGFAVDRRPGFGRKRHMTSGKLRSPDEPE